MRSIAHAGRLALRSVIRAPGFAFAAILTLALGIGLSTMVFTVADALLMRALPVQDEARLVLLWGETRDGTFSNWPLALRDVREFEASAQSLESVAYFAFRGAAPTPIQTGDRAYQLRTAMVSGNFFDVLGSRAVVGRAFHAGDDVAGMPPVLVLSHRAWREHFGGDSAVIGRYVTMAQTGRALLLVGVMPQGLEYPGGTDIWAPLTAYGAAGGFLDVVTGELDLLARLRPGASASQARAEMTRFFTRPGAPASRREMRGVVHTLPNAILGDSRPAVVMVTLAAAVLLLIACVNVANLLFVRAGARVREFALRAALGASRARIVAHLLTESTVLTVLAGLLGVGLAIGSVKAFVSLAHGNVPRLDEVGVNASALIAAVVITAFAVLVSGLAPALLTSRVDAQDSLRSGARASGSPRLRRIAEALVVTQIALAVTSLAAAALVTRSFIRLQGAELAFDSRQLLVAQLAMRQDLLKDGGAQRAALDQVIASAVALPGVEAVTPVISVPFVGAGGGIDGRLGRPGQERSAENPIVNMELAAPNYFGMLGIPLLGGRTFTDQDREGAAPVIVVSSTVANHFWPGADPIGQRLGMPGTEFTVVGVVADTRYRELRTARATVYFPVQQSPFGSVVPSTLLVRTTSFSGDIIPSLRRVVSSAHAGVTIAGATSLETLLEGPRAPPRLNAVVLSLFGLSAVTLAAIGLFGVIATMVRQRARELGVRMALGATTGDVLAMVMRRGLLLAIAGAAIGLAGTLAASRLLAALMFDVSPTDAGTLAGVAVGMVLLASIASFIPARLGTRIDPAVVLRSEG